MIRILIFIFSAALLAFLVTALLGIDGRLVADAFGNRYDIHTGAAILGVALFIAASILLFLLLRYVYKLPNAVRGVADEGRRARGLDALTKGFEAIAIGDGETALRQAEIAERKLRDIGLTRLLRAQAFLISGDDKSARERFSAMLDAPETEVLGLRGLFLQAERAGDREAAGNYAERALALSPNASWAFQSAFARGLERGAWGEMRGALGLAKRNRAIDAERARRGEAALLAADAAAAAGADQKLALQEAEKALKLAPALTPAAVLAARLQAPQRRSRALKTLEQAFSAAPHAALIDAAIALVADEGPDKRAAHLERLAAAAPQSTEAGLARALARLATRDVGGAAALLEPQLRANASARLCTLMAEAAIAAGGPNKESIARDWLKKAAVAPREDDLSRGGVQLSRAAWARLITEFMDHGRLAPPALDAGGLSEDELKRLALQGPATDAPAYDLPADNRPTENMAASVASPLPPSVAVSGPSSAPDGTDKDVVLVGDRISAARAIAAAGEVN